jgi:hypothetical protein
VFCKHEALSSNPSDTKKKTKKTLQHLVQVQLFGTYREKLGFYSLLRRNMGKSEDGEGITVR